MKHPRPEYSLRVRAIATMACAALLGFSTIGATKQAQKRLVPSHMPAVMPDVVPSLPPADQATSLRYPAYGPVVNGIAEGEKTPGVPATISLHDATLIAVALSPTLAAARADVGIAHAQVRLAQTGLLPLLAGSVSASHQYYGSVKSSQLTGTTLSNAQSNSASVTLNQLIFDGGKIAAGIRAAKSSETAAADTYRRALQTLKYQVAAAYYSALSAERTTQVDVELVRENQQQEALVAAQVRAGTAARVDQITAALPVSQAEVAVVQAQGAQISALAAFANVLGLPANIAVQPIDDGQILTQDQSRQIAEELQAPAFTEALVRARLLRPDLAASQETVRAAQNTLRQARLGYVPHLVGSLGENFSSTQPGGSMYARTGTLGAQLSIPIFDQGATAAAVDSAKANLDLSVANEKSSELTISLAVRQALAQLVSAQAALRATALALREATEVLHSTQAQYRAGVTTLPQLLNAQVSLSQALVQQVNAAYTLRQAEQTYYYAIGEDSPT